MKQLTLVPLLAFSLFSSAAEEPKRPLLSSIDIEFHGRLKADGSYDDSRSFPGNFVLWVEQERIGPGTRDDDEFNMTANESRLWFDLKGPTVEGIRTGGKVEFDFYGSAAAENKAKLMLRRAYIEAMWEEYQLSLLAGQHSDVFSPLVAYTLNYTVGWDFGNIGYRRPQFRLSKRTDLDLMEIDLTGAISRTIGGEALTDVRPDYGEDAGFPTLQARLGARIPAFGSKPIGLGLSGHWGEEQVDDGTFRRDIASHSVNLDLKIPIHLYEKTGPLGLDFELSGEAFYGANLDNYFGGISQGVNLARRTAIKSRGGWGQLAYLGLKNWRFVVGGGADDPTDSNVPAGGRLSNRFIFVNAVHNVTRQLQLGLEYGNYKTEYEGPNARNNRFQFSMLYHF